MTRDEMKALVAGSVIWHPQIGHLRVLAPARWRQMEMPPGQAPKEDFSVRVCMPGHLPHESSWLTEHGASEARLVT